MRLGSILNMFLKNMNYLPETFVVSLNLCMMGLEQRLDESGTSRQHSDQPDQSAPRLPFEILE